MSKLKKWIIAATADELRELAKRADTSIVHIHHLAAGYRQASADLAGRIVEAAERVGRKRKLPELLREDLCAACRDCPYAKACRN